MTEHDTSPAAVTEEICSERSTQKARRPYSAPVLKLYGSVSKLTLSGGVSGTEGGSGMAKFLSDPASKTNVVQVGVHPFGIGLYLFDYKLEFQHRWGSGRQFGVMADEVERVMPEAVSIHPDGYRLVDYARLGVRSFTH